MYMCGHDSVVTCCSYIATALHVYVMHDLTNVLTSGSNLLENSFSLLSLSPKWIWVQLRRTLSREWVAHEFGITYLINKRQNRCHTIITIFYSGYKSDRSTDSSQVRVYPNLCSHSGGPRGVARETQAPLKFAWKKKKSQMEEKLAGLENQPHHPPPFSLRFGSTNEQSIKLLGE